jgi:teichuronic acid biosynthesis glycosyltransferase TuaC
MSPMRIAFLCKRRYMGKDVIKDRYARLYEIPYQLARAGHDVLGLCLSYHGHEGGRWLHDAKPGSLEWESSSLGALRVPSLLGYVAATTARLCRFAPDIVIGASDIPHVAAGAWFAHRLGVPYVADLYDNFEGFGQARIPGMKLLLRRGVRAAQLATTTSEPLAQLVRNNYGVSGRVFAMPRTVDLSVFRPRDRTECRMRLGLPRDAQLVGTAGGLHRDKGVATLYTAWAELSRKMPDAQLVLAGPHEPNYPPPPGPRVHYLGQLPHARMAELFSALDVGVICVRETAFGRYSFPQKAYEMLACNLAVVAANVGAMGELFKGHSQCLYAPDNSRELALRLRQQFECPQRPTVEIRDWAQLVGELDISLRQLISRGVPLSAGH